MIVKMIGVIDSSIRFEDSIRKRIGRPIRFERKKTIRRSLHRMLYRCTHMATVGVKWL